MSCAERLGCFQEIRNRFVEDALCLFFPVEDKHLWCELKQKSKLSLLKKSVTRLSNQLTHSKAITVEYFSCTDMSTLIYTSYIEFELKLY
jgi:hypothetical protein